MGGEAGAGAEVSVGAGTPGLLGEGPPVPVGLGVGALVGVADGSGDAEGSGTGVGGAVGACDGRPSTAPWDAAGPGDADGDGAGVAGGGVANAGAGSNAKQSPAVKAAPKRRNCRIRLDRIGCKAGNEWLRLLEVPGFASISEIGFSSTSALNRSHRPSGQWPQWCDRKENHPPRHWTGRGRPAANQQPCGQDGRRQAR